jgi:hypothetical protein
MGDETGQPQIEVTEEMLRAGADAIGTGDLRFTTSRQMAKEVYLAMEAVRMAGLSHQSEI